MHHRNWYPIIHVKPNSKEYSGVVTCPACKTPTILSSIDGVDGLPNFFARRDEAKKPHLRQETFDMYPTIIN
jgi:hypothetical protein